METKICIFGGKTVAMVFSLAYIYENSGKTFKVNIERSFSLLHLIQGHLLAIANHVFKVY
jgi:hypothetical protein